MRTRHARASRAGRVALLLGALVLLVRPASAESPWRELEPGLSWGEFRTPNRLEDAPISILRIDPGRYSFRLLSAAETGEPAMTAREWARRHRLLAVVNACMYQADGITSVGYLKNGARVNNPRLNSYQAVLAFDPVDRTLPPLQIIDRECQDFEALRGKYRALIQNIRMINCRRENVWRRQDKAWVMTVLGVDGAGNVLFIFSGAPYQPRVFADTLLALPLSLRNLAYLEGGSPASFFVAAGGMLKELTGTGGGDTIQEFGIPSPLALPIPIVIGIVAK